MKIYAPVKDANGTWASVRFVNGVGETTNPALIEWFRKHGYRVGSDEPKKVIPTIKEVVEEPVEVHTEESEFVEINQIANDEPNFDNMNPNELREWAKAHGLGSQIKNIRNKEKLLEIIRG